MNVASVMASLPARLKSEMVAGWDARFLFEVSGAGTYTVWIHDGRCEVFEGAEGTPSCTVRTDAKTFLAIEQGTASPQTAFMTGKVKISNVSEMMKFSKSFTHHA